MQNSTQLCLNISRVLATTNGRDKLCRLFQYFFRVLRVLSADSTSRIPEISVYLENTLALSRQTFRLFKWINIASKQLTPSPSKPPLIDIMDAIADVGIFMWFLIDNLSWFAKANLIQKKKPQEFTRIAANGWFTNTVFNALSQILLLQKLYSKKVKIEAEIKRMNEQENVRELKYELTLIQSKQRAAIIDGLRSLLDIPVAWSLTRESPISPMITGYLGTISSIIGLYQLWPSTQSSLHMKSG